MTKEDYIKWSFPIIKKRLRPPIHVNTGVVINDLDRYLASIEKAILNYDNYKVLKHFRDEIDILLKLKPNYYE